MHIQKPVPAARPARGSVNKTKILRAVWALLKDMKEGEEPITHNFVSRVIGGEERDGSPSREFPSPVLQLAVSSAISLAGRGELIQFRSSWRGFLEQNYVATFLNSERLKSYYQWNAIVIRDDVTWLPRFRNIAPSYTYRLISCENGRSKILLGILLGILSKC